MNIVRELRIKKGIQQKELALELGVSSAAVSNWEKGKSDPSGERLKKLAEIFDVDELVILGKGTFVPDKPGLFVPQKHELIGKTETEQIVQYVLDKLNVPSDEQIRTPEARSLAKGIDKMPQSQREAILNMMIGLYPGIFEKGEDENDT